MAVDKDEAATQGRSSDFDLEPAMNTTEQTEDKLEDGCQRHWHTHTLYFFNYMIRFYIDNCEEKLSFTDIDCIKQKNLVFW